MRSERILALVTVVAGAMAMAAGCSSPAPAPTPTPGFVDTSGQAPVVAAYPAGPYGIGPGSVVADFEFLGYPNATADSATRVPIHLSDFYNPHGLDKTYAPAAGAEDDRYFPMSSGYAQAGKLKPTVLLIDIASVWCVPCNEEAKSLLPGLHAKYVPCGGEFLLDLHDSNTPGTTATFNNLTSWTKNYKVDYPAVIDPAYKLDALFQVDAYPNNVIIDTTTMKVVEAFAGEAIPLACSDYSPCNTDADCQTCQGVCSDQTAYCSTANPCASGASCAGPNSCGDGAACAADTDCAAKKCTTFSFWRTYEALLDKSRTGCMVQ
jgi:hypothetical protein